MGDKIKSMVAIPSRDRLNWLKKSSANSFNLKHDYPAYNFVGGYDPQYNEYLSLSDGILATHDLKRIDQIYDCIINYAHRHGYERVYIFDDDLSINVFKSNISPRLQGTKNIQPLLEQLDNLVCEYAPLWSLPYAFEAIGIDKLINFTGKTMNAYFIHVPTFKKYDIKFEVPDDLLDVCDLNINLSLLTDGFLTPRLLTWLTGTNNKNNPGGCSTYRNVEWCNHNAEMLHDKFPDLTRVVRNKMKPDEVYCTCKFKKAFSFERFEERFGFEAKVYAKQTIREYQKVYTAFIKEFLKGE